MIQICRNFPDTLPDKASHTGQHEGVIRLSRCHHCSHHHVASGTCDERIGLNTGPIRRCSGTLCITAGANWTRTYQGALAISASSHGSCMLSTRRFKTMPYHPLRQGRPPGNSPIRERRWPSKWPLRRLFSSLTAYTFTFPVGRRSCYYVQRTKHCKALQSKEARQNERNEKYGNCPGAKTVLQYEVHYNHNGHTIVIRTYEQVPS